MRLPFRTLHILPSHACMSPTCLHTVLNDPIISVIPVHDDVGIDYAVDIQLMQGFYVVILGYVFLRWGLHSLLKVRNEHSRE